MPDLNSVHINKALASLSLAFQNDLDSYVVGRACAERRVENSSDKYFLYGRDFASKKSPAGSTARALASVRLPGAEAAEVDYSLSSNPYVCAQYALRDLVTDEEIGQADPPLRPILDAATRLVAQLRNDQEAVFARIAADGANYPSTNKVTLTTGGTGTSWRSYTSANSDPLGNLRTAKETLQKTLQRPPNTLVLSADTARYLADHPAIKDIAKYTDPTWLTGNGLPKVLRGLNVVLAEAVADTAAEGAAYSGDYLFLDRTNGRACALVCYVPPGRTIGPRGLASFVCFNKRDDTTGSFGISTRAYREEKRKGWIVEACVTFDIRFPVVDGSGLNTGAYLILDAVV